MVKIKKSVKSLSDKIKASLKTIMDRDVSFSVTKKLTTKIGVSTSVPSQTLLCPRTQPRPKL